MKKHSGIIGILVLCITSIGIVVFNYRGLSFTVSNHTSYNLVSTISFCILGTISALLIAYSLLFCLPQKWGLGKAYKIIAGLFSVAFITMCVFPNNPNATTMHDIGAWSMIYIGLGLIPFLLIRLWGKYNAVLKVINCSVLIIALVLLYALAFHYHFMREYILLFETGYVALLFTLIISLVLGKPKKEPAINMEGKA